MATPIFKVKFMLLFAIYSVLIFQCPNKGQLSNLKVISKVVYPDVLLEVVAVKVFLHPAHINPIEINLTLTAMIERAITDGCLTVQARPCLVIESHESITSLPINCKFTISFLSSTQLSQLFSGCNGFILNVTLDNRH